MPTNLVLPGPCGALTATHEVMHGHVCGHLLLQQDEPLISKALDRAAEVISASVTRHDNISAIITIVIVNNCSTWER